MSQIDERLPLQIATTNVASRQVSGPCRVRPIGAVSALSGHLPTAWRAIQFADVRS